MNDETVKISMIVPIYNVEDYVKLCIESIIGQSYKNLEIILVDDGSTDRCPKICDDYSKLDNRIRVIHKHNGGLVSARKAGAAAATGDYVLAVDGDDWIEKNRVEVLVREGILPTHADMIYLAGYTENFEDQSIRKSLDSPIRLFENDEIENVVFPLIAGRGKAFNITINWSLWMWAIRRELLLKNQMLVDDRVINGEDFLCVSLCLLEANSVMTIKQSGYHYIKRSSSITHQVITSSDKYYLQNKIWYQAMKAQLEPKHASEKIRKICGHIVISFIIMNCDYDWLLQKFPDYLFPFLNVKSGSRIVVYGAGKIGNRLVQSVCKTDKYSVVLWVDQNLNRPAVPGYTISSRDAISSVNYDYVIVAILNAVVSEEVKRSLVRDGVPEEKIATMDASAIL